MYELNFKSWVCIILTGLFLVVGGVGSCMYIRPKYNVWSQEMAGKAEFAKAEQNRKIKIEEAKANLEAEKLNAQAEIERAKGAAEAIRIGPPTAGEPRTLNPCALIELRQQPHRLSYPRCGC